MIQLATQRKALILLAFFQFFLFSSLSAQVSQSGWSLIQENDFTSARAAFEQALKANPKDQDALTGLIFISETVQDYKQYKSYTTKLIESSWDENLYRIFGHLHENDPDKMLKKFDDETIKSTFRFSYSDSLFQKRKFKASTKLLREVIGDYDWAVIGPFTNVSGSGFDEKPKIESEAFKLGNTYKNEDEVSLEWIQPNLREPNGIVEFGDYLPTTSKGMYYASTFITTPKARKTQLRIARTTPMKIWLNGDLVFENREDISYDWDNEIVELDLAAGTHQLMIKCATHNDHSQNGTISLNYNDTYDEGEGYYGGRYNSYDYDFGSYEGYSGGGPSFGIRITDTDGKVYQDITSSFDGVSKSVNYNTTKYDRLMINYYKDQISANSGDFKNYFYLCKAFFLYGARYEGEAYFYKLYKEHEEEVFFRYLLAKFYAANGKGEKAEQLISGLDESKTPFFALMETELTKIDQDKNEDEYLATLDKLLGISPTNWGIISTYLDYYSKKGKTEEKRTFIQDFLQKYPDEKYKERLEPYLEDDSYKPSSYKPLTDKEKEKNAKDALKRMKKRFNTTDYRIVISHYKNKEKIDQALKLYDDVIEVYPYRTYWRIEKAKLMFEKDRLDEALVELNKVVKMDQFNSRGLEMIGDIYVEKSEKDKAYDFYKKALDLKKISNDYGVRPLEAKMEKIKEKTSMKEYFRSVTFEEALKDEGWKGKYSDEESVILLFTIESALDNENTIYYNQKMMIAIQNEAGAKYWTEANFGFLGGISFVKVLKKDGQVVSPNRNYGYVVFKNLEPGDIIQIEGNSEADMTRELHGEMYHIAALSHDVPVYKAKMEFIHPKDQELYYECYRLDCEAEIEYKDGYKFITWEYNNVPKMEYEDAVLDNLDSYAWIMFSTHKNWADVVKWYLRKTYRRLETNYEIENELLGIISEGMTDQEIVETIYNYVTKEITYSHVSFLNSNYIPKKPSSTISDQIGDCKDVASLMIAMLRKYGIDAYYVLVRSSNYTNSKPLPTVLAFNHVIVGYELDDGVMRYMDLTTDYYPYYVIPEFDNNSWALIVKEGEDDVFRLPSDMLNPDKTILDLKIKAKVNSDRSLEVAASTTGRGIIGGKLREDLNRVTTVDDRRKLLIQYFGQGGFDNLILSDFDFQNLEDITAPLEMNMSMKAYNHIERVSNFYILQIPLLNAVTTKPTLFNEKRYNNLDLNALFETSPSSQVIDLEIPNEFKLMDVPQDIVIDNKFGKYEMRFKKTPKGILIDRSFYWKTRLVEYQDYAAFKKFYIELLDADRMKLALTK